MTTSQPQRSVDDLASTAESADADELCINTIRTFAMDAVQTAGVRAPWHSNAVAFPEEAEGFRMAMSGELPADWEEALPRFSPTDGAAPTRALSGITLNRLGAVRDGPVGGSPDHGRRVRRGTLPQLEATLGATTTQERGVPR